MNLLSQRDPRWADMKLGTSDLTIGGYGCTITCLAMYIGTTPDVVNERLKAVNGFSQGSLVIWAKVAEAFPGVSITKLGWTYDNNDVAQNLPCLVEVDFDGTDRVDNRHWVVYKGNQKMNDPWTGTEEPTSKYPPLSYRVIKGKWLQVEDANYSDLLHKQQEATSQCQLQLSVALNQITELQKKMDSYISSNNEYKLQAEDYRKRYESEQQLVLDLKSEISKVHQQDKDYGQEALDAQHLATERSKYIQAICESMDIQYDPTNDKQLVEEILGRIAEHNKELQSATVPEINQVRFVTKLLISMGINNYLTSKGLTPLNPDTTDVQFEEKVNLYLTDVTNELLGLSAAQENNQVTSSSVSQTIVKPKRDFFSPLLSKLISLFFAQR